MVKDGNLFLKKLFHWVAKRDTSTKILVVKVLHFVKDRGTAPLCQLTQQLSRNFMPSSSHEHFLEIVLQTEVCNKPFLKKHAHISSK